RMVLSVPEARSQEFHDLCSSECVEATLIGMFTETKELVLKYQDNEVGRVAMSFLHDGRPPVIRKATYDIAETSAIPLPIRDNYTTDLVQILSSLNVSSKEWIIRQYDHEVQAGSVIKPLVGVDNDGPSDASVVRPDLTSPRGLVVSCGINPHLGDADPWWMAAAAIDEAVRNCVAVGADPSRIAILDNFCWGNTERAETLGTLVRAATACHAISIAYGTPFVSGKDSLNNEFSYDDQGQRRTVAIPSTLLITALGQIENVEQCVTMDLKEPGNLLFIIGNTHDECGGSHFALVNHLEGGQPPGIDSEGAPGVFQAVHQAIRSGLIRSCHDLSEGGLAVAVAEMAFAGGIGAQISVASVPTGNSGLSDAAKLFSESNTRFVVEVQPQHADAFRQTMQGIAIGELGQTTTDANLTITSHDGSRLIHASLTELKEAWQSPLRSV
ncbi:MAG: phosphoribosylformylglycinamidine synthase, partial [Planctomycetaceae bacterium]|nr:phosphoribosylformylglycinamidine synthase [Planctomycetaceae bacterium]